MLTSTASTCMAFAISAPFTVVAMANLLIALCFVLQMVSLLWIFGFWIFGFRYDFSFYDVIMQLFGGFLISLDSLPVYVSWLKYLSIFRYATEVRCSMT